MFLLSCGVLGMSLGRPTCMTSWIEHLGVLLEEVEEVVGKRVVLESLLLLLLHDPDPDIRHRMDE